MTNLTQKIAFVTGGGRSLGREYALKLAEAGADIILTYNKSKDGAESVVNEIEAFGRTAVAFQADLEGTADMDRIVDELQINLERAFNGRKLDILVNNAGTICHKPFHLVSEAELDEQYDIHVKGVFFLTQRLLPILNDGGRIINIGSGTTRFSIPPLVAYAPMKAAVESLTKYWAKILGTRGITVNAVAPGAMDTDFNAELFEQQPEVVELIKRSSAGGRVGVPEDVGGIVVFLCSDAGRWVTGERIEASGGMFL